MKYKNINEYYLYRIKIINNLKDPKEKIKAQKRLRRALRWYCFWSW